MSHENFDFQTSWNLRFPPLEPETSSLFWFDTSVDIALIGRLYDKLIQLVYFLVKNFVCRFLIFAYRGHLKVQLTLIVSNSVDSNFRLSRIFIEVPNFVVYKYI